MLICDHVIIEHGSGKFCLFGVFDKIFSRSFPAVHPIMWVYSKVTDAQGQYDFRLEMVNLNNMQIIGEGTANGVVIADRMTPHQITFRLSPVPLPEPGRYEFRLSANGQYVGNQSVVVEQIQAGGRNP